MARESLGRRRRKLGLRHTQIMMISLETDPWQIRPEDLVQDPGHWYIAVKSAFSSPYQNYPCTQSVGGGKAGFIGWGDPGIFIDDNTIAIYTCYPD